MLNRNMYIDEIFFFRLMNTYMRVTSQFLTHTSCIVKDLTDLSYNVTATDCPTSTRRNLDFQMDRQSKRPRASSFIHIYICTRRAMHSRKREDSVLDLANSVSQLRGSFPLFSTIWERGKSLTKLLLGATSTPSWTNN